MNKSETLKVLGLNDREASIYLAALELGTSSAQAIATKAGIQRTYFYDLSQKLIEIGLLTQTKKGNKRLFVAAAPDALLELTKERTRELEKVLPELKATFNTSGQKPKISFYEGIKGINQINDDTLRYKDEIIGFTTPRFLTTRDRKVGQEYIHQRKALGIKARVIGEMSSEILAIQKRDQEELRETRILPKSLFESEIELGAYGNKVFVIDYKEEFGFLIEGSSIAKAVKMIFEIVWNSGKILE